MYTVFRFPLTKKVPILRSYFQNHEAFTSYQFHKLGNKEYELPKNLEKKLQKFKFSSVNTNQTESGKEIPGETIERVNLNTNEPTSSTTNDSTNDEEASLNFKYLSNFVINAYQWQKTSSMSNYYLTNPKNNETISRLVHLFMAFLVVIWPIYSFCHQEKQNIELQKDVLNKPKEEFLSENFSKNQLYEDHLVAENDPIIIDRIPINKNEPTLAVVVGSSGIGKTTSICKYAKQLRDEGTPVLYISADKDKYYDKKTFLQENFGTSKKNEIYGILKKLYKGKTQSPATIIIDNIHFCKIEKNKIDPDLLTFLHKLHQGLKMSIILLTSAHNAGYGIQSESGYSNCSSLFDIGPYSKEYILDFLKTNMPKQIKDDNDAEKFYSLFDGNMNWIKQEKADCETSIMSMIYKEEKTIQILKTILDKKNPKTGYSKWNDVIPENLTEFEEIMQELENANLIVQRSGPYNEVKLTNGLVEKIIKENTTKENIIEEFS